MNDLFRMIEALRSKPLTKYYLSTQTVLTLALFLVALLPRFFGLGLFLTSDEPLWMTRSIFFAEALLTGQPANTLQTGHPGVTTMWTGLLGLGLAYLWQPAGSFLEFLQALPHQPERIEAGLISWVRLPTVILAAACVALWYRWGSRLVGQRVALLSALLLAFDPFFLAHSRTLHHDALATIFISLGILALLNFSATNNFSFLLISALLAGLALLSKGTSLILVAFAALFFLWLARRKPFKETLLAGLSWLGLAGLTFILLWPAMWVIPGQVLGDVFGWIISSTDIEDVAETTSFAWAGRVPELGVLFYPVNWLLKSTLLGLIGLAALPGYWRQKWGRRWVFAWLALFAGLFLLFLTVGDKRDGRYLLPIYPSLWLLAAGGLIWLADTLEERLQARFSLSGPALKAGLAALFFLLLVGFSLPWYPYYHTYYNPVIGGPWLAPRLVKVGWGEGMEQVAAYLQQQPHPERLVVATSYEQNFLPFFAGEAVSHHQNKPSDYVLNYIRQIQNGYPFPEYWQYYQARPPLYHLKLDGIEYAWLYPGSPPIRVRTAHYEQGLELLAYTLDRPLVEPGSAPEVTLIWRLTDPAQKELLAQVELIAEDGQVWGSAPTAPLLDPAGPSPVEGHYQLQVSPEAPRLDGSLRVTLLDQAGQAQGEASFGAVPVRQSSLPEAATPLPEVANLDNQMVLLGYQLNTRSPAPGGPLEVTLYWQAQTTPGFDYTVFVQLRVGDQMVGQHDAQPLNGQLPTSQWTEGETIADPHILTVAPEALPGEYELMVGMYRWDTGERLRLINDSSQENAIIIPGIVVQE